MRNRNRQNLLACLAILAAVFALGLVGKMDARDAELQRAYTCDMVASGAWPEEVGPNCSTRP